MVAATRAVPLLIRALEKTTLPPIDLPQNVGKPPLVPAQDTTQGAQLSISD